VATNDYQHLLRLALGGRVVTELPPFLAHAPLGQGRLVEVLPDHPLPQQTVRALVADTRLLPPLVRHFLDFTAEQVPAALEPARAA
jgi:DNA-binding transcriptional LysR family regulator